MAVVNPAQIAAFRQSLLGRHKTDRADAQLLARFAALHHAELRRATPDEPDLARLRQFVGVRDDLVASRRRGATGKQAAQWAGAHEVVAVVAQHLAQIETVRHEVEQQIAALLASRPETAALTVQIGVGILTAAAVLAYLPAGVLGPPQGRRRLCRAASPPGAVRAARPQPPQQTRLSRLRRYLYLAAMSAIQHDREIQAWYRSLCERGKAPQSATCAVAHKLLRRMMGRLRDARAASARHPAPRRLTPNTGSPPAAGRGENCSSRRAPISAPDARSAQDASLPDRKPLALRTGRGVGVRVLRGLA